MSEEIGETYRSIRRGERGPLTQEDKLRFAQRMESAVIQEDREAKIARGTWPKPDESALWGEAMRQEQEATGMSRHHQPWQLWRVPNSRYERYSIVKVRNFATSEACETARAEHEAKQQQYTAAVQPLAAPGHVGPWPTFVCVLSMDDAT